MMKHGHRILPRSSISAAKPLKKVEMEAGGLICLIEDHTVVHVFVYRLSPQLEHFVRVEQGF